MVPFSLPGQDKAEAAVISVNYGGAPRFLVRHGYGPEGRNPRHEMARWRSEGKLESRSQ